MPVTSSDTLVIENTPVPEKPSVAMTFSGQLAAAAKPATAEPNVFVAEFGNLEKHPNVSSTIFEAHDTTLDWIRLSKKLESFRNLKRGWDGYKAAAPNEKSLESVTEFLDTLRRNRYLPSRLAPSVVGGVGLTFREDGRKVYLEFSNKGTVHALFSDDATEPVVQKVLSDTSGYRAIFAKMRAYLDE